MEKIIVVFGTRPEAIKMCPLVQELQQRSNFQTLVCVTGQHRQMLDQVLQVFKVIPDYDLSIMQPKQSLAQITAGVLQGFSNLLRRVQPKVVLVHGDTNTTFAAALACFYQKIPVGHVEAGLRTYELYAPFPEEFNRQAVGLVADLHFAPTVTAKGNLLREGKAAARIYVTGNTAIDAMRTTVRTDYTHSILEWAADSRLLLLTAHRRENLGEPLQRIFRAILRGVNELPELKVVYPVHLNPAVQQTAMAILGDHPQIRLIEPLDVLDFHNFMARSYLILTDSGGIQEEAPALGKPVLVLRDTTERPEGITAGTLKLVGTKEERIYQELRRLVKDEEAYTQMSQAVNPYGDGFASRKISNILVELLGTGEVREKV